MSADDLFSEGNEAFVDDDYSLAVQKYTAAIELDSHNPKYYIKRAAAFIKMEKYQDAIADASSVITLEPGNGKAFFRKGIALYQQSQFKLAKEALDKALDLDGSPETKKWVEKCNDQINSTEEISVGTVDTEPKSGEGLETENEKLKKEAKSSLEDAQQQSDEKSRELLAARSRENRLLSSIQATADAPKTTQCSEPAVPKAVAKPRYDWYQNDARVVITILVKNTSLDDVKCDIKENSLSVCVKLEDRSDYTLSLDLAHEIVPSQSKFKVLTTKIELQLKKAESTRWPSLEAKFPSSTEHKPTASTQMYPTSCHTYRNWDKLAADIEKEEKDEKLEGDAALNALFQQIYGEGSDEVKRAMNKSFVESGGTVLSTNWGDVGKKTVECKPPDGMEFKKY